MSPSRESSLLQLLDTPIWHCRLQLCGDVQSWPELGSSGTFPLTTHNKSYISTRQSSVSTQHPSRISVVINDALQKHALCLLRRSQRYGDDSLRITPLIVATSWPQLPKGSRTSWSWHYITWYDDPSLHGKSNYHVDMLNNSGQILEPNHRMLSWDYVQNSKL